MKSRICTYGDPVLRHRSRPVTAFDDDLRKLAEEMRRLMLEAQGVGLAAQQVGEVCALFVLDIPPAADLDEHEQPLNPGLPRPLVAVNPEIIPVPGAAKETAEEGCLSLPEIRVPVTRPAEVILAFQDLEGRAQRFHLRGLAARAAQHEFDHLQGVLICDRVSPARKITLAGRLKRLKKHTLEERRII